MIAYFDCFSGISGDMILGALVDAGISPGELENQLSCLQVKGYKLRVKKAKRAGLRATKVDVVLKEEGKRQKKESRKFKDIEKIIRMSTLPIGIKQKGLNIFKRLFKAEAKVHGKKMQNVHLHELAAVDCIVDIFGTLIGLDALGIKTVYSSALNLGSGTMKTEHGLLPVPAPATVELLRGIPVYSSDISFELTTPTGAVLISSIASKFGPTPNMNISKIGVGAGSKNLKEQPNVLRLLVGQITESCTMRNRSGHRALYHAVQGRAQTEDSVVVIETNIDDMNPQVYEYVIDKLFKTGALDVFLTQVIMKKGRPGIKLTVICSEDKKGKLIDVILKETTSIGLRFYRAERNILQRKIKSINTKFGRVNVKVSELKKKRRKISVEYEDCKKIAKKFNIPLLEVMKTIVS